MRLLSHFTFNRKLILSCSIGLFLLLCVAQLTAMGLNQLGDQSSINVNWRSIAIKGYDPVAYFTKGSATKGSSKFEHQWLDATWRFSNANHREMFVENPEMYAPRFGGYCAGAVSLGRKAPIDPEAWIIVDGKLYLHYNKQGRDEMAENPQQMISTAEKNWNIFSEKLASED